MPRPPDSGQIDLTEVFHRVQQEMLAQLAVGRLFEHASAAGWPGRPEAAPASTATADGTGRTAADRSAAL